MTWKKKYGYILNRKIVGTSSNKGTKIKVFLSVVEVDERFLMRDAADRIRKLGHTVTSTQALGNFAGLEMRDCIVKDGYQRSITVWKRIK